MEWRALLSNVWFLLTVECESLTSANPRIFVNKELEVIVGIFDGPDFILIIDEVSISRQIAG